ncbi:succinylglutamate desuccinylase/aspartoacylase family protein [Paenibacillus eucommiae]|uniref:Deacylase n=1 Tax=Paenibacillus eucommiae TaxID=1355755 RepID=A0ABS4INQ4_9BACL|nr:succinylglutamate desuccinylase/aspartoacylase family protein [Paenibacillus eucommiae]MBP1988556.1 putative deacylase [Paenibacillus eucommiae]
MHKKLQAELFDAGKIAPGTKESLVLSFSTVEGPDGQIPLHIVKGSEPGPTMLVLAAVHGDEYEGVHTLIELCRELHPKDIRGTLLMVPITNLLSYYGASRETPEDGCNLAREFPGKQDGTVTQRLAWHLDRSLIAKADFLLDLHSGGANYAVPELVGYYHNDDDEVGRRSRAAAEAFGMEILWAHPELNPGRTVSAATEHGVPWLYTEGFGGKRIKPEEQKRYRSGTLRIMNHLGMLLQPEEWIQEEAPPIRYRLMGDGNFDLSVTAEVEGFFIPTVKLLDQVAEGDRIGAVYDWFGEELQIFKAYGDGLVVGMAGTPMVQKGSVIYTLTTVHN